jgi:hypothetical protein
MDAPATPIIASTDVAARLRKLASTLRDLGWTARFVAPPARQPFLFIQNPEPGLQMLHEYIHASPEDGSYWWSWAEPIAADAAEAAATITRVLRSSCGQ